MGSRMVRVRDEDIESINQLCDLAATMPFSAKVHALVRRLQGRGDLDALRAVVREELERVAGAD